jgi:hypothetical protein
VSESETAGLIKELRDLTGRRIDVLERDSADLREQVHQGQIALAEIRGAQGGIARLAPWLSLALSALSLAGVLAAKLL